jgi:hypothetical protein
LGLVDVNDNFFGATGRTKAQMDDVNKKFEEAVAKHKGMSTSLDGLSTVQANVNEKFGTFSTTLGKLPKDINTVFNVDDAAARKKAVDWAAQIKAIPENIELTLGVQADGSSIAKADGIFQKTFPDGRVLLTNVAAVLDAGKLRYADETLKKTIPDKTTVDIQAKLDMEKLKIDSDKVGKMIEWKAKIDIAQIESSTKIMEASFKSLDNTITSTGTTLSSMVGSLAGMNQSAQSWEVFDIIKDENKRRNEALELQKKLVTAQVEQMQARTKAMGEGKALIEIDGKGLQPHLEAFMFEILAAVQVKATAEGQKYLVGI